MMNVDHLASTQANVQTLFGLSGKAFEAVESLVALNLQVARAAFDDAEQAARAALSVKEPQALFALQAGGFQPSADKAAAYVCQVGDIAAGVRAEFGKAVGLAAAGAQGSFAEMFDAAAKNAPAGSENSLALWKSAVATANNAFDSLQKAARQASDVAEANYNAVTAQAAKATGSGKARRA
jgi:phasin family protein